MKYLAIASILAITACGAEQSWPPTPCPTEQEFISWDTLHPQWRNDPFAGQQVIRLSDAIRYDCLSLSCLPPESETRMALAAARQQPILEKRIRRGTHVNRCSYQPGRFQHQPGR